MSQEFYVNLDLFLPVNNTNNSSEAVTKMALDIIKPDQTNEPEYIQMDSS